MRAIPRILPLLLSVTAWAGDGPAPKEAPVAAKAGWDALLEYHLSELHPVSVSAYSTGISSMIRTYLHLRNRDGHHYLVVEEDSESPPLKELEGLQRSMSNPSATCSLDLRCEKKAFCTGKCTNMYYQLTNLQSAKAQAERCHVQSYTCDQGREPVAGVK